ncbi:MAG: nucleotidyltransferase family protein [Lysobacteraceae bacterium]|nr:MAG: nucleotidyltransferase family protein [Xanthomonadaceae bacterium]
MTEKEFAALARRNPVNDTILRGLPRLGLPDAWLVSGCLFQTAWNIRTGRDIQHGIRDHDLFYFDPDTSYAAEDAIIRRVRDAFPDIAATIEVRNQARVHLWYTEKFGAPYPPLQRATDGIDRFLMDCAQVGMRSDGTVYAPKGLADLEAMIARPNRTANFQAALYRAKVERWKAFWPELTILPAMEPDTSC